MTIVIKNPPADRQFHVWHTSELYWGENNTPDGERFYPRVNDLVIDTIGINIVLSVNDFIPTTQLLLRWTQTSTFNAESTSLITALSGYQNSVAQKAYLDTLTDPATITIDVHYISQGLGLDKMVFFRGTDTSENGEVISEIYNSGGTLISNEVPMNPLNPEETSWQPQSFKTTKTLLPGELITGVIYRDNGNIAGQQTFTLLDGVSIRSSTDNDKVITGVSLVSSMISPEQDDLILNPKDTPLSSALITARLHYSDGDTVDMAIDGVKMVLMGLNKFDTSRMGTPYRILLGYYPDETESYVNGGFGGTPFVSKAYYLANVVGDESFTLKVFIVPTWDAGANAYTFRYRLLNLAGDLDLDVTGMVTVVHQGTGDPFSGSDFTNKQSVILTLPMSGISPTVYGNYVHTQKFDVTVDQPGAVSGQHFIIDYIGDEKNIYGVDIVASVDSATGKVLNISQGLGLQSDWLNKLYFAMEPLYDRDAITEPVTPTHFIVEFDGQETDKISVGDYINNINLPAGMDVITENDTVAIRWIHETAETDIILAITPMFVIGNL